MNKFHKWYDSLKEPWRFFTFMSFLVPLVLLASYGGVLGLVISAIVLIALIVWRREYLIRRS